MERAFPRVAENPFDSARKTMSTLHRVEEAVPADPFRDPGQAPPYVLLVKGAPDVVLASCTRLQTLSDEPVPLTPAKREQIAQANALFSGEALRVLAVAYRSFDQPPDPMTAEAAERELIFVGLIGL